MMVSGARENAYIYSLLLFILILGGILRTSFLGDKSLWLDEFFSLRDSPTLKTAIDGGHPPLFFIILNLFRYIGSNEFILRLPSAIFGILTILLIYQIGKLFFGTKEGLISAFLLSISTFHIHYSQEARMYTLFTFLSLLSLFFFYKAVKENKRKHWFWFILSTVLSLYTHYFAIFIVFVEATFLFLVFIQNLKSEIRSTMKGISIRRTFLMFVLSMITITVIYLPWLAKKGLIFSSVEAAGGAVTWMKKDPALYFLEVLFSKFGAGPTIALYVFLFFFLCGSALFIKKEQMSLLLLWVGLPITLFLLISNFIKPMINVASLRYVIFVLPIYLLIVATGIVNVANIADALSIKLIKKSKVIGQLLVFLAIISLFSVITITPLQAYYNGVFVYHPYVYNPYQGKANWKGAVQYLETHSVPGDAIVIEPEWLTIWLSYYFDHDNFELHYYHQDIDITFELMNNQDNNITFESMGTNLTKLKDIQSKYDRVWVVISDSYTNTEIVNWFYDNYALGKEFAGDIHVYLMQPELFKAAIFKNTVWDSWIMWKSLLRFMGASTTIFNETTLISDVDLSEYQIIVLADFIHPLDNAERLYLEESVRNGLIAIVSGSSPYHLAGDTANLTRISKWFGATALSEAPKEERWKVKFTKNAAEITEELDLDRGYAFYTVHDWSSPIGCIIQPESVAYAYRVNDGATAIFTHEFENGTSIFFGPSGFVFDSPDAETFQEFVQSLIRSVLTGTS